MDREASNDGHRSGGGSTLPSSGPTEHQRAEEALRHGEARHAFLVRLGDAIRPLFDPIRIQAEATRVLGEHLGASRVHYAEIGDDQNTVSVHADFHAAGGASIVGVHRLDSFGAYVKQSMLAGRTLVLSDTSRVAGLTEGERVAYRRLGTAAYVCVPLVKMGRLVALLAVHHAEPRGWAPKEVELVEETAERTWAVVERAHAEQALRESEAKYRSLFTSIDEGFCILDVLFDGERCVDYRFREVNPAFERLTGLTDATGRRIRELVPGHDEHWFEICGRVALTGESVRLERPAAALGRFYDLYTFRIGAPEQRRVAVIFNDITERKRAEAQLHESDRRKNEYLAMLGHELRNPLGAIRNATEVLKCTGSQEPRLGRIYELLERQSSHMSRIIDDLLDVSRIAQGKIGLELGTLDVRVPVERIRETWGSSIAARGLELCIVVAPEPLWIVGDDARLTQVLDNLVGNAQKFTPAPGTITVVAERDDRCAVIRVRDTGVGVRPERLPRIFALFEQDEQDVARHTGGLGLGLALCKGLVELHHGTIEAHSAGPDRGTELVVRLPLAAAPVTAAAPGAEHRAPPRCVLLVEDNVDAAQMLHELLRLAGHDVTMAATGREALEALRRQRFDVVLCDLGIPDMSGLDVARAVRAEPSLCGTTLVALTGHGQPEDRRRTAEAGFDDHLIKPVDFRALHAVLARLVGGGGAAPGVR